MRIAFRASPETIINTHMGAQSGRSPSESSNCVFSTVSSGYAQVLLGVELLLCGPEEL